MVLIDLAGSGATFIVIKSMLLAEFFVILCPGGPGRLHLVFKISVGLEILVVRQHILQMRMKMPGCLLRDANLTGRYHWSGAVVNVLSVLECRRVL